MCDLNKDEMQDQGPEQPGLDVLQAGLFYLMTQYSFRNCPRIAEKVVEHLTLLCNHPQIGLLPAQNNLYARLINVWRARQYAPHSGAVTAVLH